MSYVTLDNYYTFLSNLCFFHLSEGDNNASWSCCEDWRDNNKCRASGPVLDPWWLLSCQWPWTLQFHHAQSGPNLPLNSSSYVPTHCMLQPDLDFAVTLGLSEPLLWLHTFAYTHAFTWSIISLLFTCLTSDLCCRFQLQGHHFPSESLWAFSALCGAYQDSSPYL